MQPAQPPFKHVAPTAAARSFPHRHAAWLVRHAGVPPGGYGVAGDEHLAGPERQADGEGALEGGPRKLPHRTPGLLHRDPHSGCPGTALHDVDGVEVAVAVLVLDQDGEVVRVRAAVHFEGQAYSSPVTGHAVQTQMLTRRINGGYKRRPLQEAVKSNHDLYMFHQLMHTECTGFE